MKFQTIRIEGNTISADILEKISEGEYKGQQPKDFSFETGVKVKDEIARAWADAQNQWKIFKSRTSDLDDTDTGLPEVRKYWMIPLLGLLDYNVEPAQADKLDNGNSYPISHRENKLDRFPVYIVGFKDKLQKAPEERSTLDIKPSNATRKMSPHALVQEYVNLTEYAYGIVTNGLQIRLLRDSSRLVKLSFLEFDLEQIMEEEVFADFALLFRVLHASRLPRSRQETADSLIEQYHQDSIESGARIREGLSEAVEKSIRAFANGFLKHSANQDLRDAINKKEVTPERYYQQQLRLIYRLLFLMVTEERNLIYPDNHNKKLRDIYYQYYSVERLRRMVDKRFLADSRYSDHWEGLKHSFQLFEKERYGAALAIKPLNGELFGINALGLLSDCALDNQVLLECIRNLTVFVNKNTHQVTRVNYASLNVEEFGSVYEGLLEYDPVLHVIDERTITFDFKTGEERASSGSHYTPEELVQPLIKHSLDYVIQRKLKEKNNEAALLSIKVCDVACGSGHILLSAARRIAFELARIRTGEDQPTPNSLRLAIRDVVKNCIYGVDRNPLAVELCKVALWLESHNPGEPLGFLDHHIKCGDAIVGLAHREELEEGIANEAFKSLLGDDKDVASSLLKQNKAERKEREAKGLQLKTEFDNTVQGNVQEAMEQYGYFIKLPERTPEEVEAKERAYNKFLKGKGYSFLKAMADTQVAQFFIPKTQDNKERLMTDGEFRRIMSGYGSWQSSTHYSSVVQQEQYFFHWFLEFPEVFQQGGFDCIMGNPPYIAARDIKSNIGETSQNFIKSYYLPNFNKSDLVGFFFRRDFNILNGHGFMGLISTNTISQGDTRKTSLEIIVTQLSGTINYGTKSIAWPGKANTTVSLIGISKGPFNGNPLLNGRNVNIITPSLEGSSIPVLVAHSLHKNQNLASIGSQLTGEGFKLSIEHASDLILKEPDYKQVLFPFITGDDINKQFDLKSSTWVVDFQNRSIEESKKFSEIFAIALEKVKPEREGGNDERGRKIWWQHLRNRFDFYQKIRLREYVLVNAVVSKYPIVIRYNPNTVFSNKNTMFNMDKWYEAILNSSIYQEWVFKHCTTMGASTINFGIKECLDNFPFPLKNTVDKDLFESLANELHELRLKLLNEIKLGITKIYNFSHFKYLTSVDIELQCKQPREICEQAQLDIIKLRELHTKMDHAVLEAYGWQNIQLRHNFHEVDYLPENDRVRYTIHSEAREEILRRLLELNHEMHEEELKAGLWDKKKVDKPKKIERSPVLTAQESLFSDNFEPMLEFDLNTGIYSSRDAAEITGISRDTIRRWFKELSNASYEGLGKGDVDKLRISFHGLIELVVIGTLRENNFSLQKILKAREDLKKKTRNHYPFATSNIKKLRVAGSSILFEASATSIITLDGTGQFNLEIIKEFFKHVEFNTEGIAKKLFPVKGKGKIAIDPKVGQGKPVIKGKSVWAETIAKMYTGPESISLLKDQYNLKDEEILAAVEYCSD
jgi:uncharacterized protein (DUF433 family)